MRAARTATALLCTAILAAGAAGCGGSELDYEEVPGPPAGVPVPSGTVGADDTGDADAGADAGADATPTPTAEPGTTAPSDQSGDAGSVPSTTIDPAASGTTDTDTDARTDSGGAPAPAEEDSATNDTAPPAGSEAQQFEDFCAQNPGAC